MPIPANESPDSICLIRLSAIGDCCHTVPVVRTIQTAWPRTRITWIIGRTEHALMEGMDGIEFIIFDKSQGLRAYLDLWHRLSGRRFDILLHMHASMRANLVSLCVRSGRRIGFDRIRARDRQHLFTREAIAHKPAQHVMDGLFGFAEHIGISTRVLRWDIPLPVTAISDARKYRKDGPLCVISPCSSQRFRNYRNWRAERYAAVVRHLVDTHKATVLITGAPTDLEREFADDISRMAKRPVTNLIGATSLKSLMALVCEADLVICPDSGPAHMATAAGTPVIGLYATSNRQRTGPYFSQHLVADAYPDAIRTEFDIPIDQLRWGQRVRNPAAMDMIQVSDVVERIDRALGDAGAACDNAEHLTGDRQAE
jgi:heptosyltransferase I